MGSGKGGQTIGYHYFFDILFGVGRGPMNELHQIKVGDKMAWEGTATNDEPQAIKKPNLFGGEKKEGGIQGPFRMFMGFVDQVLPGAGKAWCGFLGPYAGSRTIPNVKTAIGGPVSEMRGQATLWYSGLISSMNPYPKVWSLRIRRHTVGWKGGVCWYPEKCMVPLAAGKIQAMNAAHIIYQLCTDPLGRGLPVEMLDENSFINGANALCGEAFGLCFNWQRKELVDEFIGIVLEHVGGALYPDPETGKLVFKLLRADYVADDLPLFTPTTGLLDIKADDAESQDEIYNEVSGKGHDPIENKDILHRVAHLAARMSQGATNTLAKEYPGIPTRDLLLRVIQRDLRVHASGLKKYEVVLDRRGWSLRPGMCFRVSDDRRGIANVVLRIGEITDQSFTDGRITVKAIQDVYGLPATSYVTPTDSTWEPPTHEAAPAAAAVILEANFRDAAMRADTAALSQLEADDTISYIGVLALSPDAAMYEYTLATRAEGETDFRQDAGGSFTGSALLDADIGPYDDTFILVGLTDVPEDFTGQAVLIGNEEMAVVAFDSITGEIEVKRGVADTIPATHAAGARLWTKDDDLATDLRAYSAGEDVEAKVLTRTFSDVLSTAEAPSLFLSLQGRISRPYPPGNVTVDTLPALTLPGAEHPEPEIAWTHRDRILQADQLVGHEEGDVGPEAGTTYIVRVYNTDEPSVIIREVTGIATTSWTYDATMQLADGSPGAVIIELRSSRDDLESYFGYSFIVVLNSGYGYGYGFAYGGS